MDELVNLKIARPYVDHHRFRVQVGPGEDALVKYLRSGPGESGYVVKERNHQVVRSFSESAIV